MSKEKTSGGEHFLFSVQNMCGEYVVSVSYSLEKEAAKYSVKVSSSDSEEKAVAYMQKICDEASKHDWGVDELRAGLERFGDPHYDPIPWEQEDLPKGAIE